MNKDNTEIHLTFPTPVWTCIVPNFENINSKMFNYIKSLESKNPKGNIKSNVNGWHSDNFDLESDEPRFFINSISTNLNKVFTEMGWDVNKQQIKITNMWSIINNQGASNARHIHSNNYISAAYYVKAPNNCGNIVFHDPRSAAAFSYPKVANINKLNSNIFSIQPKEGLLVMFPSFLHHSVNSNESNQERIVISFNINFIQN